MKIIAAPARLHLVILFALTFFVSPSAALASAVYTTNGIAPYANGIALKVGSDFISSGAKTSSNVTVVISVESLGKAYTIDTPLNSDSYTFTENGSFQFIFHDIDGATGSSTVTIDNIDRTPPVITIGSYSTAYTNSDVEVTASTNEGTLSTSSHIFTENGTFDFVATDEAGNVSTSTVTVSHIDKTAPVITANGDLQQRLREGATFVDGGASATDNVDAIVVVQTTGSVNTSSADTYTLTYTATDTAGNSATPVTRTVEVIRAASGGGGGGSRTTSVSSPASAGRVLGASIYSFSKDLAVRDTGEDVLALQGVLKSEGFFTEVPTGYYGPKTVAAVMAYQAAHGIRQTGVCGPLTRAALGGGTAPVSTTNTVEAQISLLLAQVAVLKAKLASLTL